MEWAELAKVEGIRSIICLLHQKELDYYTTLDLGASDLLAFYGQQGFEVWHLPWEDPAHSKTPAAQVNEKQHQIQGLALQAFDVLPRPVLVHCSAGEQRSAPVAAYIESLRHPGARK